MRRYGLLLQALLASILVNHVCCAESTDEDANNYVSIASQVVYVEENDTVRDNRLSASLYISNHEIWFSGTSPEGKPWLICTNDRGEILFAKTLEDAPGKRVYVRALSKVEDTLLLGIIDFETQLGTIGVMRDQRLDDISYYPMGDAKITQMVSAKDGMLVLGLSYDMSQNTVALSLSMVGCSGDILFQTTCKPYDIDRDKGALSTSPCYSFGDRHYVQENIGDESKMLAHRELVCFDSKGSEIWRVALEENISVLKVVADGENAYLLGIHGEITSDGLLVKQKALVQCYSSSGENMWSRIFDTPASFQYGDAGNGVCVTANSVDEHWYLCVLDTEGAILAMQTRKAEAQYINSIALDTKGMMIILGMTPEQLFIQTIPFQ